MKIVVTIGMLTILIIVNLQAIEQKQLSKSLIVFDIFVILMLVAFNIFVNDDFSS